MKHLQKKKCMRHYLKLAVQIENIAQYDFFLGLKIYILIINLFILLFYFFFNSLKIKKSLNLMILLIIHFLPDNIIKLTKIILIKYFKN